MAKPYQQIVDEISAYIDARGGEYQSWYVGIVRAPRSRLFDDHAVHEKGDPWIYRAAESRDEANRVEAYFVNVRKTQGGPGGGDEESKTVYAYLTGTHTREEA